MKLAAGLVEAHISYLGPEDARQLFAWMVFVGLGIMVPLTTMDLLKFSALSVAYFQLLAHMLEVYPERILALPGAREALSTLLRALMQRMLEEPSGGNLVELAADAALPLILFCPKAFQSLARSSLQMR
ncbi:hypothetical protein WJX84_010361 [Apatococcus fuscideae]|uniref:Uncharacterized protein n=1 Tax=Apatococcus fuscideae TaxID=2026836 RepID=A0AAW1RG44_9CHLO